MITLRQKFFAENYPLKLWLRTGVMGGIFWAVKECEPSLEMLGSIGGVLGFLVAIPLGALIGFFVSSFFASIAFPLRVIYDIQERCNGKPFAVGDRVRILTGKHREKLVTVYEIWKERSQLRVELGLQEAEAFEDVFSFVEVCREANTAPATSISAAKLPSNTISPK